MKKTKEIKFPEIFKSLLKKNNWTQKQFAEMINYSEEAVYKWANYKAMPGVFILMEIAEIFDVSIDYLLYGVKS